MQATRTIAATTEFQASSTPARAGFLALSAAITFTLLAGIGQVADRQYDDAVLAQLAAVPMAAVITGSARG
ncbi:MAG: hypothetical protein J0M20_12945 [Burkholderiales bacterium]|nr:hypothetical protein [Burkholderiales bacterium]